MSQYSLRRLHHLLKKSCSTLSQLKQIHAHLTVTKPFFLLPPLLCNLLLRAYSKSSDPHRHSFLLFRHILLLSKPAPLPDSYTFTFTISSCSRHPTAPILGETLHCHSVKSGFCSDTNVTNSLINMYSTLEEMALARQLFDEMPVRDVVSWTSLIKGYVRIEELPTARKLFNDMPYSNAVSWAVVISGYVNSGLYNEALRLFNAMLSSDCREIPNEAIVVCVLSACAHLGALGQGEWIHAYIDRLEMKWSSNVSTALINMYSRCGRIESAKQVFHRSLSRDAMTWTSMISGLALHGLGDEAVLVFYQMLVDGVRPDSVTVLGVLNACSHAGLVDEGRAIFYNMSRSWKIFPTVEHYGCLIDLLGRAGQSEKALAIIIKMPIKPDMVIWRALLSAARSHGNVALSERIMDHIAGRDLDNQGGGHVLLSNLYASVGRWDEVASVRKRMEERSKGLRPGCSWIEVDGVVHEFVSADRVHPQIEEIRSKLDEVLREVSLKGGYAVDTKNVLFDLSEEDKERAVYWHSEKLAVVFGLMSVEARCCIRIMKNLRICEDCHSLMEAISKVFDREIIVRDRSRFHTFREGGCSCKDYW